MQEGEKTIGYLGIAKYQAHTYVMSPVITNSQKFHTKRVTVVQGIADKRLVVNNLIHTFLNASVL